MRKNPKLIDKWLSGLPADARSAIQTLTSHADSRNLSLFLVGGPLRDLLLGHPSLDIDLSVQGDAISLAREVGERLGIRPRLHTAFGTATIPGHGWHIDLATARSETYRQSGALPTVTPATIEDDLRRRDFTINAMALGLNGPRQGAIIDPSGGRADLHHRIIRVLHERSFQDDATRILRAVRYSARLGFGIEPRTLEWLRRDVPCVDTISAARLHHEFARTLREPRPGQALSCLHDLGVLRRVHPALSFDSGRSAALAWLLDEHPHSVVAAGWPLLALEASPGDASEIARRLALTRTQRAAIEAMSSLRDLLPILRQPDLVPSRLAEALAPFPSAALWALAAVEPGPVRERCLYYLERLRHLKTALNGDDLISLGVPEGPQVGHVLRRLRVAKLDGEVKTRTDEERLVRNLLTGGGV